MDMIMQNMMMQQPAAMTTGNDMNAGHKGQASDAGSDTFSQMMEAADAIQDSQTGDTDPADSIAQSVASQFVQTAPVNMIIAQLLETGLVQTGILSGVPGTEMAAESALKGLQNMQIDTGTAMTAGTPAAGIEGEIATPVANVEEVLTENQTLKEQSGSDKGVIQSTQNGAENITVAESGQPSAYPGDSGHTDLSDGQQKQTAMTNAGTAGSREAEKDFRVTADHTEQVQFNPSPGTSAERGSQIQQNADTTPILRFSTADQAENIQKLSEMIKNAVNSSVKELEIQLEPANLGKITLKATYEAGKAAVVISCTNSGTLEALSRHAAELGGLLQDHMGGHTEIVIDQPQQQYLNEDGRSGGEDPREEQRRQHDRQKNRPAQGDFLEQLRLGLV